MASATMTPKEVQALFNVTAKTVRNWADRGILNPQRLPSGHRRYLTDEVIRLHEEMKQA